MGLMLLEPEFHTRCFVEWEKHPRESLIAAQRHGYFARAPIWDDVTTFDGKPFCGAFDTILAGYPCQPFSQAGQRKGEDDERHLWPDIARIIREVKPTWVTLENVSGHVTLGAETVLRELHDMGFKTAVGLFSAAETGSPHQRLRWFCVAYSDSNALLASRRGIPEPNGRDNAGRRSGENLGNASRIGWDKGQSKPIIRGGGNTVASTSGTVANTQSIDRRGEQPKSRSRSGGRGSTGDSAELADANGPEFQGQFTGQRYSEGWQKPHEPTGHGGRARVHPPGPSDTDAWAETIRVAPDLSPATAFGDIARRATELIQMVEVGELEKEEAESSLRRMVDGLASRARALKLLGNGVHPLGAANAMRALFYALGHRSLDMDAAGRIQGTGTNVDV